MKNYKMINLLLGYEPVFGKIEASELLNLPIQWVVKENFRNIFKLLCKIKMPSKYFSNEIVFELLEVAKSPKMGELLLKQFYLKDDKLTVEIAMEYNMIGIIEYFIRNNASFINRVDNWGCTYLNLAIKRNRPRIIELMIKLGFNINAACNSGFTPLHYAIRYGSEIIVKILIENGANIETKTHQWFMTPLMGAIMVNRLSIAKILIEHGASLKKRNIDGMSPLEIALQQKKFDIAFMIPHCESK